MEDTSTQYDSVIQECRDLFVQKMDDYGTAWRILRLSSLTDQIFIKAKRIRELQQKNEQKIDEGQRGEFIGIINYSAMALIQFNAGSSEKTTGNEGEILRQYDAQIGTAKDLMLKKNHDYGEAWRDMRISSLTDLILQKLLRVKQIEENRGETQVSEGVDANYRDILNYAVFALILML